MGMFLSLSGVIGKTEDQVRNCLTKYATEAGGGLQEAQLTTDDPNCCVLEQLNNNTTILYPQGYVEWDKSSEFISRELNAPVFSFHVHDGDLWMYVLYVNGQVVDQFNPIPDYWDDNISEEEIQSWKGDASVVANHIGQPPGKIERYLRRWDLDSEDGGKAYEDDMYTNEDWQLLDFLRKCGLPYPMDDDWKPKGNVYKLWTKELSLSANSSSTKSSSANSSTRPSFSGKTNSYVKPWWKFWG